LSQHRPPVDWIGLRTWLAAKHPALPTIEVTQLHRWLGDSTRQTPLLIDIRSAAEQHVSTIRNALCFHDISGALQGLDAYPRTQPMVTVCAVGVRSARLGDSLRAAGFESVHNLEGGLFQWAMHGLPLECEGAITQKVHPFDADWQQLLDSQYVAYQR
jgi:rhodanese-related sulfurtransferase